MFYMYIIPVLMLCSSSVMRFPHREIKTLHLGHSSFIKVQRLRCVGHTTQQQRRMYQCINLLLWVSLSSVSIILRFRQDSVFKSLQPVILLSSIVLHMYVHLYVLERSSKIITCSPKEYFTCCQRLQTCTLLKVAGQKECVPIRLGEYIPFLVLNLSELYYDDI